MTKSKSKKRKLTHSQAHPRQNPSKKFNSTTSNLTQEEIWDDSALLRSWNEAVAEYEFYHSIHAKGEDVDEVLRQYHAENGEDEESEVLEDGHGEEGEVNENEADEKYVEDVNTAKFSSGHDVDSAIPAPISGVSVGDITTTMNGATTTHQPQPQPQPTSQTLQPADLQNQTLENIKMAYYWAGYYSGLYDGQRQSQTQPQNQVESQTQVPAPAPAPTQNSKRTVDTAVAEAQDEDELEEGEV